MCLFLRIKKLSFHSDFSSGGVERGERAFFITKEPPFPPTLAEKKVRRRKRERETIRQAWQKSGRGGKSLCLESSCLVFPPYTCRPFFAPLPPLPAFPVIQAKGRRRSIFCLGSAFLFFGPASISEMESPPATTWSWTMKPYKVAGLTSNQIFRQKTREKGAFYHQGLLRLHG